MKKVKHWELMDKCSCSGVNRLFGSKVTDPSTSGLAWSPSLLVPFLLLAGMFLVLFRNLLMIHPLK